MKHMTKIDIYSGSDELTVPFLSIGAKGVISVAANIVPKEMRELCSLYFEGNDACLDKLLYILTNTKVG